MATLRGHVQRVFQVAWSADCRLLVSAGEDSTIKLWSVATRKLLHDLPGHADAVSLVFVIFCIKGNTNPGYGWWSNFF